MTRAEFAKEMTEYIARGGYLKEGEDIAAWAKRHIGAGTPLAKLWAQICDVATNGFDPEPTSRVQYACKCGVSVHYNSDSGFMDGWLLAHNCSRDVESAQESAKRSRPFVGSHKLPHDTDWD